MTNSSQEDLTRAITEATRLALTDLFFTHPENYYYITLTSTGDANTPVLSAWSHEALDRAPDTSIKWSYADSPYCMYGFEEHFSEVEDKFRSRIKLQPNLTEKEYEFRYSCMETALASLDAEGFFGTGKDRDKCVIAVEVMPPDSSNIDRVKRLNPALALVDWLAEAAEE